jgi:hypothetical protein
MTTKTSQNLTQDYLNWLGSQIQNEHSNPDKTYQGLLFTMFEKNFEFSMPMDENRMVDGLDLRVEFARENRLRPTALRNLGPCSFLEVVIGLSRRLAFIAGGDASIWAWTLLSNLELHRLSDPFTPAKQRKALTIMDTVINRSYSPDGTGGFFPLAWPDEDQTGVELWYQMNAYATEIHPEH